MQLHDNEFFEEYKHLDKLCSEMYSCQNGVSEYISQMENKSYQGQTHVYSWDSDYKMLKHVRWVRTQLAHESVAYQISEPEDLAFVRDFYNRIFLGQDPLTMLRKSIEAEAGLKKQQSKQCREQERIDISSSPIHTPSAYMSPKKKSNKLIGLSIGIGILVLVIILLYMNH